MPDYMVEMLVGEEAVALSSTLDGTNLEIAIDEVSVVKNVPGSVALEIYEVPPDTHYYIGPTEPTDPSILVWYDTTQPV